MASIRKRGENSYLIVVSRGYDYEGNRLKSAQKTVHPPMGLKPKQVEKWLQEQAVLYEREIRHIAEPVNKSITLAKYIEHWLADVRRKNWQNPPLPATGRTCGGFYPRWGTTS